MITAIPGVNAATPPSSRATPSAYCPDVPRWCGLHSKLRSRKVPRAKTVVREVHGVLAP